MNLKFMSTSEELKETQDFLRKLEERYIGTTPAQTATLQNLKNIDLNYHSEKKILETKIAYLQAVLEKEKLEDIKQQIKYEDCLYDAIMDGI